MPSKTGVYLTDQTLSGYVSAKSDETAGSAGPFYYLFVRPDGAWYLMRRSFAVGIETDEYIKGINYLGSAVFDLRGAQTGWDTYDKIF